MRKILTRKQKARRSLIGGIAGLIIGGYMIFYLKNNLGFIPALMGVILLVWRR